MSDLESLLLLLAVIYGVECLVWVRLGAVAFTHWTGARWRLRQPSAVAGNARGGLVVAPLLPPMGTAVYGQQLPVSLAPEGVIAFNPGSPNGLRRPLASAAWFRFDEIKTVGTDGKFVTINGARFVKTSSEAYAFFLAEEVKRLQRLPLEQRAGSIKHLFADQLSVEKIQARLQAYRERIGWLRVLANSLFASVFLLAPILINLVGLNRCWWVLLGLILVQMWPIAYLFRRAHRALVPKAAEERFTWVLTMVLAAPSAMRASDILGRRVLETFHPLALAKALCAEEAFKHFAGAVIRDLHHPAEPSCPTADPAAAKAVAWSLALWRDTVKDFMRRAGQPVEQFLARPKPSEPVHASYCPRCLAQFVVKQGACADCGGKALEPLEP